MQTYDVAVIGSGMSGLIAANALADAGKAVVVFEKSDRIGGRAMTVQKGRARFNLGAHALYRGGEAYAMLQKLGVELKGKSPGTRFSAVWMDQVHPLPANPVQLLTSPLLTWAGRVELGRWLVRIGKMETSRLDTTSLRDWAERELRDPMVRHIIYAVCRTSTYIHDPNHAAAGPVLKQVQRAFKNGVQYLDGGWQTMVDQLRDRAERSGAVFLTNKRVVGIDHDTKVRGLIFADGDKMNVPCILSTARPAEMYPWIKDADRTALRRWKEDARPAMVACLDLCLKRLPVAHRNLAVGLDLPVFFTNQSAVAHLTDDGTQVMHLLKYNGAEPGDPNADRQVLEHTMNLLHPGWKDELLTMQFLPNMMVAPNFPHAGQTDRFPGPVVPEIRGLYVAGDWASHGELLVDAAAASAQRAVEQILNATSAGENGVLHTIRAV
jgi:phytoene dehydrogenase-like protein